MKNNLLILFAVCFIAGGCKVLRPDHFKDATTTLDPVKFFGGRTHSSGVLEARNGKPSERITTKTIGSFTNGILTIEQDLYPENNKQNHRSFSLRQTDANHVEGTGSDIQGTARGELYGNYFTWTFRLKISRKGLVKRVKMSQHFYLMPDGKTMIIRSTIRKFGFIVTEITEQFVKED